MLKPKLQAVSGGDRGRNRRQGDKSGTWIIHMGWGQEWSGGRVVGNNLEKGWHHSHNEWYCSVD